MSRVPLIKERLEEVASEDVKRQTQRFFKTNLGEYSANDVFIGIKVPTQRKIASEFLECSLNDVRILLDSAIHEHRLTALIILIEQYRMRKTNSRKEICTFYLENTHAINNWDLVDISAPAILGDYLLTNPRTVLYKLAKSTDLWEQRISIVSTLTLIRNNEFGDTYQLVSILLNHSHDLIHKAMGWMLREVGKRDMNGLESFLKKQIQKMPRTTLRYAIERFPEDKRQYYLKKK